jgi:regulator of nucleoside diphosphate kinase
MDGSAVTLTQIDVERLGKLIPLHEAGHSAAAARLLKAKIATSPSIPAHQVPPNLVTMNSVVVYRDERTRQESKVVIVYPDDADTWRGRISILSPVCAALLGLRVGQAVDCALGDGTPTRLRVTDIPYQPEQAGDLHL